jgi:glycosyltransferase involved in cell wall biosynthesis
MEVSVIIPTHTRANLIGRAIQSVLNQIYSDFELIIVNDCSLDNTEEIVKGFKDQRIVYLKHEKNRGVAASCNTGVRKAMGDYIFILNDDDLITPWALEKLVKKIEQSDLENLGGIYNWSWWINDKGKTLRIINSKKGGYIFNEILKKQVFTNLLIKKEVFEKVGLYDENLLSNEDFDFYLRMAKKYQFDFVPEILMVIRSHSQTHLSTFTERHIRDHAKIIKRYSSNWRSQRFLFTSFFPSKIYINLSNFKNFIINQIKLILNPKIKKEINLIKKTLTEEGIKI